MTKVKKFNFNKYNLDQIIESLTCPVNRHCTRVEHNCDDWELFKNPEWLIRHFTDNGGAVAFARHREEKKYWIEVEDNYELEQKEKETLSKQSKDTPTTDTSPS